MLQETETPENLYISANGNSKLLLQEVTCNVPKKQTKKSALKKFLFTYDIFAIFTSVERMKISFEAKVFLCLHYKLFNYL